MARAEPTQDKVALLAFISRVPHEPRVQWNANASACGWVGVNCDASNTSVVELRLPGVSLVGPIPAGTLSHLASLRVLSLRATFPLSPSLSLSLGQEHQPPPCLSPSLSLPLCLTPKTGTTKAVTFPLSSPARPRASRPPASSRRRPGLAPAFGSVSASPRPRFPVIPASPAHGGHSGRSSQIAAKAKLLQAPNLQTRHLFSLSLHSNAHRALGRVRQVSKWPCSMELVWRREQSRGP